MQTQKHMEMEMEMEMQVQVQVQVQVQNAHSRFGKNCQNKHQTQTDWKLSWKCRKGV